MTLHNPKLLSRLAEKKALIIEDVRAGCTTYAAYPGGDRRCRPISWISKDVFSRWLSDGVIVPRGKGFEVSESAGLRAGSGAPHRKMVRETISGEDGVFRPASVNLNTRSVLRSLAQRLDKAGDPFLNAAELSAGEQFSKDYARANYGKTQTQNYAAAGSDRRRANTAEDAIIAAIDSEKRITAAIDYVGPGLSRAVISICGKDMGLEEMERMEGWTRRSGRTVLKLALQRLSEFYGTTPGVYAPRHHGYSDKVRASL